MNIDGAVLIFLPGWNTISMLRKYLQAHPRFRNPNEFLILSLHSQVPREDQRLVFRPTPPGVRKARFVQEHFYHHHHLMILCSIKHKEPPFATGLRPVT